MRRIGSTDLTVHPLCLGGNVFGWTLGEADGFAVLDAFRAGGGNFIDTADIYTNWEPGSAGGESETIIGAWMRERGCRDEIVLATKVGGEMAPGRSGLKPAYVRAAVEDSLRRLGTDHVDLLYAHFDDLETPVDEALWGLDELVRAGKVRALGASNFSAERLTDALAASERDGLARYVAIQPRYNLIDRAEFEGGLDALCRAEELAVMPYYALANGLLTGKYRRGEALPDTPRAADVAAEHLGDAADRAWDVVDAVGTVAARRGATSAQVALAWLLEQPTVVAPIASATSPAQVEDLLAATESRLEPEDLALLGAAGCPAEAGA
jgi:aryl-alcohol dehydrogenase-like predicted oxidoreductase